MAVGLYLDHHVPRAICLGLRVREVDVVTAYEDGADEMGDPELLDRARELGRVLFTRDDDLLVEATERQRRGVAFAGVVYAHQLRVSIGRCVQDLEIIAQAGEPAELVNEVIFLPL
ncbi:MAG: DUF5615 family PIN-like protein [Myxococcota bacterium]